MVTVRTYWSPAEAGLAKSVLDNYEIPCALLDENSNLSARGAQFAAPVRLVVDEAYAARAIHILNGDFEKAAEIEVEAETLGASIESGPETANRNPWELLVLAFYLLVPAILILRTKYSDVIAKSSWTRYVVARARITHFFGWFAIFVAVVLVVAYFQVRRSAMKSQTTG
jgi:Putative prokaryotic signal transducing protein